MRLENVIIRTLLEKDIERLAHTFTAPWSTFESTLKLWKQYFKEQQEGIRTACLLVKENEFLGYGSLLRSPDYPFFRDNRIPEVNAIWVAEECTRQGLGTRLIGHLEEMARQEGYKTIGIGVGLYKD
jgi:ribosomal protein S18 acetylase RimI-like enzyme